MVLRERERVDTALCGADRRVDTRAEREHTFYRRVWRAKWLLLRCPNSLSHTLFTYKHRGGARGAVPRLRASVLSRTRPLSLFHSPHSVTVKSACSASHRIPCTRARIASIPATAHKGPLLQPSLITDQNKQRRRIRTKRSGAHTASSTSQHRLSPRATLPFPHVNQVTSPPVPESMFHLHLGRLCCGRGARLRRSLRHQLVRILLDEHLQVWWWVGGGACVRCARVCEDGEAKSDGR